MKLQRYDFSEYMPTITETWVKASDAEALEKRVEELESALREIADFDDCDCESCQSCIAKKALRGGE